MEKELKARAIELQMIGLLKKAYSSMGRVYMDTCYYEYTDFRKEETFGIPEVGNYSANLNKLINNFESKDLADEIYQFLSFDSLKKYLQKSNERYVMQFKVTNQELWREIEIFFVKEGNRDVACIVIKDVTNEIMAQRTIAQQKFLLFEKEKQEESLQRQLDYHMENIRFINERMIETLGALVEFRDNESGEHIKRIKEFTRIMLNKVMEDYPEYGLTNQKIDVISIASAMHDVGKISVPDNILLKPSKLTYEEFEEMKKHTIKGCKMIEEMLAKGKYSYSDYCYDIARHHHERYDGKGYPDGLKGEEISIEAQVVSITDVFDALVSDRCYKKAYSCDRAIEMILNGECGVFNPKLLNCLVKVKNDFKQLVMV